MDIIWDGITRVDSLQKEAVDVRAAVADASKVYDWPRVLKLIADDKNLINTCRLNGKSFFTPLHQAAHGGATIEIVQRLIDLGAWRTHSKCSW